MDRAFRNKFLIGTALLMGVGVLALICYFGLPEDLSKTGVLRKEATAGDSYILLNNERHARLIDRDGNIVRRWPRTEGVLKANGNFLGLSHQGIKEYSFEGKLVRETKPLSLHHDFAFDLSGNVVALFRKTGLDPRIAEERAAVEGLVFFDSNLNVVKRWHLADHTEELEQHSSLSFPIGPDEVREYRVKKKWADKREILDWSHLNNVEVVPENDWGIDVLRPGNILLSLAEANLLIILDSKSLKIIWGWGQGVLERQHDPHFLDDGRLMVFNNRASKKQSEVLIVDIASKEVVRSIIPSETNFFTPTSGSARPSGENTILATLADFGELVEFDYNGDIKWQYRLPSFAEIPLRFRLFFHKIRDKKPKDIKTLGDLRFKVKVYRAIPYPKQFIDNLLNN